MKSDNFTVRESGDVGIGTGSPDQKLHVAGNINIQDGYNLRWNNATQINILGSSTTGLTYTASKQHFLTYNGVSAYTELMTLDDTGVGIGTTSPEALLDVDAGTSSNQDNLAGKVPKMILKGDGKFGLGTTSTDGRLEVAGGTTLGFRLSNVGDSGAYDQIRTTYNGYNSGTPEMITMPMTTPGSGTLNTYFRFSNSNGSSTTSNNKASVTIGNKLIHAQKTQLFFFLFHHSSEKDMLLM